MSVFLYMYVYVSVYVCVHVYAYVYVCVCVCAHVDVHDTYLYMDMGTGPVTVDLTNFRISSPNSGTVLRSVSVTGVKPSSPCQVAGP